MDRATKAVAGVLVAALACTGTLSDPWSSDESLDAGLARDAAASADAATADAATATDAATGADAAPGLGKIVGGYYPNWTPAPVRIRDVDSNYNLIYLFAATPVGGPPGTTGAVSWSAPGDGLGAATHFNEDLLYARTVQGRLIILSVGGAGSGMSFPTRDKSQAFLDSVVELYTPLRGFDGLDWNTFEADQEPDTEEMIWISLRLKELYPGFLITAPPAPWSSRDQAFCAAMVTAGAMDYAAPQYYDGPGLAEPDYIVGSVAEWVALLGPAHVVVGFGVWNATNYLTIAEAVSSWNVIEANHPGVRGAFNWQIHADYADDWAFARQVGPLVLEPGG